MQKCDERKILALVVAYRCTRKIQFRFSIVCYLRSSCFVVIIIIDAAQRCQVLPLLPLQLPLYNPHLHTQELVRQVLQVGTIPCIVVTRRNFLEPLLLLFITSPTWYCHSSQRRDSTAVHCIKILLYNIQRLQKTATHIGRVGTCLGSSTQIRTSLLPSWQHIIPANCLVQCLVSTLSFNVMSIVYALNCSPLLVK